MPGRASTAISRASRISSASINDLEPDSHSPLAQALATLDEHAESSLRAPICAIFNDAQKNAIAHRKLSVRLRKIQEACAFTPPEPLVDRRKTLLSQSEAKHDDFMNEFSRCMLQILVVKKTEPVGDRLVNFVGAFLQHACECDEALVEEDKDAMMNEAASLTTCLVNRLLSILLELFLAKEKTVRYRGIQLVVQIVHSVNAIDDSYYGMLRTALMKRIRDKEAQVRIQATAGLIRLMSNEDDHLGEADESDDGHASALPKLLQVLQTDPSAEVRRSLLIKIPIMPATLPYLVERARDIDPAVRRILYSRILPNLGDFRRLSLSMRDKLLRWGLKDRDEQVRKATARLFRENWIGDCARTHQKADSMGLESAGDEATVSAPRLEALLELLERIDIINAGTEDGMAKDALHEFWTGRPDYVQSIQLDGAFWDALTPESIFVARTLNDFYRNNDDGSNKFDAQIDENMPELTRLAFMLQSHIHALVSVLREKNAMENGQEDDETVEREFIVEQLLHIGNTLDLGDEMGRRKLFSLLREIIVFAELPEEITRLSIEMLRRVCGSDAAAEREFVAVVLEAIAEVHDLISVEEANGPEIEGNSFHSARSEITDTTPQASPAPPNRSKQRTQEEEEAHALKEILVNMKCLHIAQSMMQHVTGKLQDNVDLVGMLNNLIVPAVRSHEAPIRERGLVCLGLCCLRDQNLAEENLSLFIHCFNKGHEELQVTSIHILADVLAAHPSLLKGSGEEEPDIVRSFRKVFNKGLHMHDAPSVQTAATVGLCRLMLMSILSHDELLRNAAICYFDPASANNLGTRQALNYFFPVYCYSRAENMDRMARIAGDILHAVISLGEELEEGEEMIGLSAVGHMLVDWTDPRKLVVRQSTASNAYDMVGQTGSVDGEPHLIMAETILSRVGERDCSKEERKALFSMLGRLFLTAGSEDGHLHTIVDLLQETIDKNLAADVASRNATNKALEAAKKAMRKADGDDVDEMTLRTKSLSLEGQSTLRTNRESQVRTSRRQTGTAEDTQVEDSGAQDSQAEDDGEEEYEDAVVEQEHGSQDEEDIEDQFGEEDDTVNADRNNFAATPRGKRGPQAADIDASSLMMEESEPDDVDLL